VPSAKQQGQRRAAASAKRSTSGRYTPPIPRDRRHSPPWYPYVLVGLLVLGLLAIIGDYAGFLPGGTHTYYLVVGIAGILGGLFMAVSYH
jgi:hypothetical protein